jgi:hypothetical protein
MNNQQSVDAAGLPSKTDIQRVIDGDVDGAVAAEILRAEHEAVFTEEKAVETRRALIARAEAILIYGAAGRPTRQYPPTFGVNSRA